MCFQALKAKYLFSQPRTVIIKIVAREGSRDTKQEAKRGVKGWQLSGAGKTMECGKYV